MLKETHRERNKREKEKGEEDMEWRGHGNASPCDGNFFHLERHEERERALGEKEASEGNSFHRTREIEEDRGRIISLPHMREREGRKKGRHMEHAHACVQEISPRHENFCHERERGRKK